MTQNKNEIKNSLQNSKSREVIIKHQSRITTELNYYQRSIRSFLKRKYD